MSYCRSVWVHVVWDLSVSYTWVSISFFKFGNFLAIVSSVFNILLALFSFWDPYYTNFNMLYYPKNLLFSFFKFSFCCSDRAVSIVLS